MVRIAHEGTELVALRREVEAAEALGWLERAIEEREAQAFLFRTWPFLDPLRHASDSGA